MGTCGKRSLEFDLLFGMKAGIMALFLERRESRATLAQTAEQTLRKRQVKGSSPLGGLECGFGPQQSRVGAFCIGIRPGATRGKR